MVLFSCTTHIITTQSAFVPLTPYTASPCSRCLTCYIVASNRKEDIARIHFQYTQYQSFVFIWIHLLRDFKFAYHIVLPFKEFALNPIIFAIQTFILANYKESSNYNFISKIKFARRVIHSVVVNSATWYFLTHPHYFHLSIKLFLLRLPREWKTLLIDEAVIVERILAGISIPYRITEGRV